MKTLVTGGAGFLGSHIVRALLAEGKKVRILTLPSESTAAIEDLDVETMNGDVTKIETLYPAVKGCDEIYHVAGVVSYWRRHREKQYKVHVEGTRNICRVALESGIKKMIHTSSAVTIGFSRDKDKILNEKSTFNQERCNLGYVETKKEGEEEVLKAIQRGLNAVIVNPATMFGERDYDLNAGELIVKIAQKKMPAAPSGGMNFIDVTDAAYGHLLAMKHGRTGERYLLGCENLTYDQLFEIISDSTGVAAPKIHVPYFVALFLGYLGNIESFFTKKYPNITPEGAKLTGNFLYYDSSKAITELGLPQTPVKESIARAVTFYRRIGIIQ
jgi:dihydroflavonol-4-reductase